MRGSPRCLFFNLLASTGTASTGVVLSLACAFMIIVSTGISGRPCVLPHAAAGRDFGSTLAVEIPPGSNASAFELKLSFLRMSEEQKYEAHLQTFVAERIARMSLDSSHWERIALSLKLWAFSIPCLKLWLVSPTPHWRDALDGEHRSRERFPPHLVLTGWHNVKIYPIRPFVRARFYIFGMRLE